jgi:chemotaxis protein methyltransferase CheR
MLLAEEWSGPYAPQARILATDLSTRIVARAEAAEYDLSALAEMPPARVKRHFEPVAGTDATRYRVRAAVRSMVTVGRLNLMEAWPMKGPFEVIMCRNVMIYFDAATQEKLVNRFHALLAPGGSLLVGHSESLSALAHRFRYVQPATYIK